VPATDMCRSGLLRCCSASAAAMLRSADVLVAELTRCSRLGWPWAPGAPAALSTPPMPDAVRGERGCGSVLAPVSLDTLPVLLPLLERRSGLPDPLIRLSVRTAASPSGIQEAALGATCAHGLGTSCSKRGTEAIQPAVATMQHACQLRHAGLAATVHMRTRKAPKLMPAPNAPPPPRDPPPPLARSVPFTSAWMLAYLWLILPYVTAQPPEGAAGASQRIAVCLRAAPACQRQQPQSDA